MPKTAWAVDRAHGRGGIYIANNKKAKGIPGCRRNPQKDARTARSARAVAVSKDIRADRQLLILPLF